MSAPASEPANQAASEPPKGSAEFWDARYAHEPERYGEAPNAFLKESASFLPRGTAYLPADGQGRNGIWLASEGFTVTTLDLSPVAVRRAQEKARAAGITLDASAGSILDVPPPAAAFSLVALIFFHTPSALRRRIHSLCANAVVPGRHLIIEGFSPRHLALPPGERSAGPTNPDVTFAPETLYEEFAGLTPVFCKEVDVVLREGERHDGPATVTRGLFRRPA